VALWQKLCQWLSAGGIKFVLKSVFWQSESGSYKDRVAEALLRNSRIARNHQQFNESQIDDACGVTSDIRTLQKEDVFRFNNAVDRSWYQWK